MSKKSSLGVVLFACAFLSEATAWGFAPSIGAFDPKTGVLVINLSHVSPSEAKMIKAVYGGAPNLTVKQTKDGFEVTGQQSEQVIRLVTLLAQANGDFQTKVLDLESKSASLRESYQTLRVLGLVVSISLIALVGVLRNQVTKFKVRMGDLQASIESLKKQ